MNKLFDLFNKPKYFKNWSENINNNTTYIKYPRNDADIKHIIIDAKNTGKIVKVIGSSHSISPVVSGNNEKNMILISLEKYSLPENIIIDEDNNTVTVNTGLKLGNLYDELNKHNYFLETQPASSAFSIGGVVSMPVHGARLGFSIM